MKQVAFPAGHQISKQEEEKKKVEGMFPKNRCADVRLFSLASTVLKEKRFQTHLTFYAIAICVGGSAGSTRVAVD